MESENPTGSMKDRVALAMIEAAEADGRLTRGGSVVEYTAAHNAAAAAMVTMPQGHPAQPNIGSECLDEVKS